MPMSNRHYRTKGFSLIELAMVLMIVGLLLGGLMVPLSSVMENKGISETKKSLEDIKEALLGYAVINGRLPCPAASSSSGRESFCTNSSGSCGTVLYTYQTHGRCSNPYDGFLPAATLGITPTDTSGFAVDAWSNRIRYALTISSSSSSPFCSYPYTFSKNTGMSTTTLANLACASDLLVCSSASTSSSSCSVANSALTNGVPAIIFSTGPKQGAGTDEVENIVTDNDRVFVSHAPTSSSATNGEFDDIVVWLSPNVLVNRMIEAGKLP